MFGSSKYGTMRRLQQHLWRHRKLVALALSCAVVNQVFSMLDPLLFRHVIDTYAMHAASYTRGQFLRGVAGLLAAAVGVAGVSRVAKNLQDYLISVTTQRVGAALYAEGIRHAMELPYRAYEDHSSGALLGTLQKARADSEKLIASAINVLFTSLVGMTFVTVYALRVHWLVGPTFLASFPLIGVVSSVLSRKLKQIQVRIAAETAALGGTTIESLRNIEIVKSLGLVDQEQSRLDRLTRKILDLELCKARHVRALSFIQGSFVNAVRTVVYLLVLGLIYEHAVTVGQFIALQIYSFSLFTPLQEFGHVVTTYRDAEVSLGALGRILRTPPERPPAACVELDELRRIAFEDVDFQHGTARSPAVASLSFAIERGETVAFVGPSGAGKTTMVKLLLGLYQPDRGAIVFNGTRHDQLDLPRLRSRIGLVAQDNQLFSATIRDNLRFVCATATDDDCLSALRAAGCEELVTRAPRGLDSVIGEGGVRLSGGEKQRLSIARALIRQPLLLILDEATSALDSITEERITQTVRNITAGRTLMTLIIAHRLSSVRYADRIYVLQHGRVIEQGCHDELLARRGLYHGLWQQQAGESALHQAAER